VAAETLPAVTLTFTVPTVPVGTVAVSVVSFTIMKETAGRNPKSNAVAPVKPEPVNVITFPPARGPFVAATAVTRGAACSPQALERKK